MQQNDLGWFACPDTVQTCTLLRSHACAACCLSDRRWRLSRRRRRLQGLHQSAFRRATTTRKARARPSSREKAHAPLPRTGTPRIPREVSVARAGRNDTGSLSNMAVACVWGVCAGVGTACTDLLICLICRLTTPMSAKFCGIHLSAAARPPSPCSSPRGAWMHKQYGSNAWRLRPCPGSKTTMITGCQEATWRSKTYQISAGKTSTSLIPF